LFQVAAELNRAKSATFLINAGASAAVWDSQGNSVISLLIERLPSVALKALDQFHLKDRINRKQFFYLNCLEPHSEDDGPARAKTPLEVILSLSLKIILSLSWGNTRQAFLLNPPPPLKKIDIDVHLSVMDTMDFVCLKNRAHKTDTLLNGHFSLLS
jgi:hypothetical protein